MWLKKKIFNKSSDLLKDFPYIYKICIKSDRTLKNEKKKNRKKYYRFSSASHIPLFKMHYSEKWNKGGISFFFGEFGVAFALRRLKTHIQTETINPYTKSKIDLQFYSTSNTKLYSISFYYPFFGVNLFCISSGMTGKII